MSTAEELVVFDTISRSVLSRWGVEDAQLDLVKRRENAVYKVTLSDGSNRALRIHRDGYHTDDELRSEFLWMQSLNDFGIHTPTLIPATDGSTFVREKSADGTRVFQCDMLEWVAGSPLGSIEENSEPDTKVLTRSYRTVGELMGKLHNHASEWILPDGFTRHAWDLQGICGPRPFWGEFWKLDKLAPAQVDLLLASAAIVRYRLEQFGQGADRYGLIHADFLPENLLADGSDITLIDFDDAGFGWHMFDIATSVYFFRGHKGFDAILNALVEGYRSVRDLPDSHLAMLPTFLMARSLTYIGWIHTRRETDIAKEMADDVIALICDFAEGYCS